MHDTITTGPDFLQKLSDVQLGNGLELDAHALRINAQAWQEDRATIDTQAATIANLQDKLDRIGGLAKAA